MKRRILILSLSNLNTDPRINRQIRFLKNRYELIACGMSNPGIDGVDFILIDHKRSTVFQKANAVIRLKIKNFEEFYWALDWVKSGMERLKGVKSDLIICNDISSLPLATRLAEKSGAKVLLDAHEYTPREFDDDPIWRFTFRDLWDYVCKTYLRKVSARTTVSESISDEYEKNYGGKWNVITNAVFYENLSPKPVTHNPIRMIHHGGVNPSRKMENMIKLIDHLDERFELTFMLVDNGGTYCQKLKRLARHKARVKFREPVAMQDISRTINEYDIGLYLLPQAGFNNRMALPNKLFEFIQARLAVATWPSPEMAKIVRNYGCGLVSDDYSVSSMAKCLNQLSSEDVMLFKEASNKAAATLCAEINMEKFNQLVNSLLASSKDSPKA